MATRQGWRLDLAMIRQRAAALNGLTAYPADLIRLAERVDRLAQGNDKVTPGRMAAAWQEYQDERARVIGELSYEPDHRP